MSDSLITIRFFASLREQLGRPAMELASEHLPDSATVAELIAVIVERIGPQADALNGADVQCAVNQQIVSHAESIRAGDEVAFFPPVTGG